MGGEGVRCQCIGVGMVGEWSALMGASNLPLFYYTDSENLEITIVSGYVRESRSKEVESNWLKGV